MTGIEAFQEVLAGAGITTIFGNPGTTELPLNDGRARDSRFRYIFGLHEIPVMAAADGYTMASGKVAAVPLDAVLVQEALAAHHNVFEQLGVLTDPAASFAPRGWALGWGIGCALGVKLAWPDRPGRALLGDGSAMYGIQGLWTAARHNIPVTFVVCNNARYKILRLRRHAEPSRTERARLPRHDDRFTGHRFRRAGPLAGRRGASNRRPWQTHRPRARLVQSRPADPLRRARFGLNVTLASPRRTSWWRDEWNGNGRQAGCG